MHEIDEHSANLVAAQDGHEESGKADGRHRRDGVFGGGGAFLLADPPLCVPTAPPSVSIHAVSIRAVSIRAVSIHDLSRFTVGPAVLGELGEAPNCTNSRPR
jgi:hypothetical protein